MGYPWDCLEPGFLAGPKPLLTGFGTHHKDECDLARQTIGINSTFSFFSISVIGHGLEKISFLWLVLYTYVFPTVTRRRKYMKN